MSDFEYLLDHDADHMNRNWCGEDECHEFVVTMPSVGRANPRRIYELVCDDLSSAGLLSEINHQSRSQQFFSDDIDFCIVHENDLRHCQIVFSDIVLDEMSEHFDGVVFPALNLRNRRQWRIVKPLVLFVCKALNGQIDYELVARGWNNISNADSEDISEMMLDELMV